MVSTMFLCANAASAQGLTLLGDFWDLSFKTGLVSGHLSRPIEGDESAVEEISLGGVIFGVAINRDIAQNWTGLVQMLLYTDLINSQIFRQTADVGFDYHIIGGARRTKVMGRHATIETTNSSCFSLLARGGFGSVSIRQDEFQENIDGTVYDMRGGIGYRGLVSQDSDAGFELLTTVASFFGDANDIDIRMYELIFYWRKVL